MPGTQSDASEHFRTGCRAFAVMASRAILVPVLVFLCAAGTAQAAEFDDSGTGQEADSEGPDAPATIQVSGLPGTTVRSAFTVTDESPPISAFVDADALGRVQPEDGIQSGDTVDFVVDIPASARTGDIFVSTIRLFDSAFAEEGNGSAVTVTITVAANTENNNLTQTQREVARSLDAACNAIAASPEEGRTAGESDLLATCRAVQAASAPGALLSQLAPEELFTQTRLGLSATGQQVGNMDARLQRVRTGNAGALDFSGLNIAMNGTRLPPALLANAVESALGADSESPLGAAFGRWGFFVNGNITETERDGTARESGYDDDSWGLTAGADYRVSDAVVVGGSLGYNRSDTSFDRESGGIETEGYSASVYGGWFPPDDAYYIDAIATYGINSYDTERAVNLSGRTLSAQGDPDGYQLALGVSAGYDLTQGPWTLGLQLRTVYSEAEVDGYEEAASGNLPGSGSLLSIGDQKSESLISEVAAQMTYAISTRIGVLLPTARVGWEHQFEDEQNDLTARFVNDPSGTTFRIASDDPDRDFINAGAGLSAQFAQGRSAFIFVESVLGRDEVTQYSVDAGIRLEF